MNVTDVKIGDRILVSPTINSFHQFSPFILHVVEINIDYQVRGPWECITKNAFGNYNYNADCNSYCRLESTDCIEYTSFRFSWENYSDLGL